MKRTARRVGLVISSTALVTVFSTMAHAQSNTREENNAETQGDIIVTATRSEQALSRVPISVAAMSQEQMDNLGVRSIADVAALTPGLTFSRGSWFSGSNTSIIIRGVTGGGDSPTAIYIDDVPVQARSLGNSGTTVLPRVFDLDRIEVLRGPQGTLFGSSAEGGAVRFITPKPDLQEVKGYGRAEVSATEGGAPSYEAGLAVGGPIVTDLLAIRVSGSYSRSGGWIDRAPYPPGTVTASNTNAETAATLRGAMVFRPIPDLEITPAVFYQKTDTKDTAAYWVQLTDLDKGVIQQGAVMPQPVSDYFVIPSLGITYSGPVTIVSNTSYMHRYQKQTRDYTTFDSGLLGIYYPTLPGQNAVAYQTNGQDNFTQELRVQSSGEKPLQWVIGGLYSRNKQTASQRNIDNYIDQLVRDMTGGVWNAETWFGAPLYEGKYFFASDYETITTQKAVFGQTDIEIVDNLKLTAGVRVTGISVSVDQFYDGTLNGGRSVGNGVQKETIVTPKFGASYQMDNTLLYVSAGKGFRPGGAQSPLPTAICGTGLAEIGLSESPLQYQSDRLWSYEAGVKSNLLGNKLQLSGSAYIIKRSNLQTGIYIPSCGYGFTLNVGESTNKGFDLSFRTTLIPNITLQGDIGYIDSSYDNDLRQSATSVLAFKGDKAYNGSPFTASLTGIYTRELGEFGSAYLLVNYAHASATKLDNPASFGFDATIPANPATDTARIRLGWRHGDHELSFFVNNLFNAQPQLGKYHLFENSPLYTAITFRPRTAGLTYTSRF